MDINKQIYISGDIYKEYIELPASLDCEYEEFVKISNEQKNWLNPAMEFFVFEGIRYWTSSVD